MPAPRLSQRRPAIAMGAIILVTGLAARELTGGAFAKYAGIALYAALIYAIVVSLAPRVDAWAAGSIAVAICWTVEFAQLTPVPAALSARSTLAGWVLGSTFHPPDLFWYVVGAGAMVALHLLARARRA